MQVIQRKREVLKKVKSSGSELTPLRFYLTPPVEEISLEQFESFALDRLTVLKQLEQWKALGKLNTGNREAREIQNKEVRDLLKLHGLDVVKDGCDKDNISHFILRLAFCSSEDLRKWLQTQEAILFQFRFEDDRKPSELDTFFASAGISFEEMSDEEYLIHEVDISQFYSKPISRDTDPMYKIPFEQALSLIRHRNVLLSGGVAYVPKSQLISIVVSKFRAHIGSELAITFQNSKSIRDARLLPIVSNLSKQSVGHQYKHDSIQGHITIEQIPLLAKRSFPLCMENLYIHLTADSHLRYNGRQQLGLFIKELGLTMEDALEFWRRSFSKKTPNDKFQKEYAYNIRHSYGKEGKRVSYTAFNCVQVINQQVSSTNEHHGCPFKNLHEHNLRNKLLNHQVSSSSIEEIIKLVQGQHYQIACQKYFAATHGNIENGRVGNHPNAFVQESMKYYKDEVLTVAKIAAPAAPMQIESASGESKQIAEMEIEVKD